MAKVIIELEDKPDGTVKVDIRPHIDEIRNRLQAGDKSMAYGYAILFVANVLKSSEQARALESGIVAPPSYL